MANDPFYDSRFLIDGTNQAELVYNELIGRQKTAHGTIKSRTVATPPGSPAIFDGYLVPTGATGAWVGLVGSLVFWINSWVPMTPKLGMSFLIEDEDMLIGVDAAGKLIAWDGCQTIVPDGSGNIVWDVEQGATAYVVLTLASNELKAPIGMKAGRLYTIFLKQATASREVHFEAGEWTDLNGGDLDTGELINDIDHFGFIGPSCAADKPVQIFHTGAGAGTVTVGTGVLPSVSRRHTANVDHGLTPGAIAWNTDRITLDPLFFSNATDNDIEVVETGNYQILVTSTITSTTGTFDLTGWLYVDDVVVAGTERQVYNTTGSASPSVIVLSAVLTLTAGERVGPRFERVGDAARSPANNMEFSIVFLQVEALPGGGIDTDAIHDNVSGEIAGITEKATPVSADLIVIEDSAASNAKKRVQVGNLPGGTDADAIHDNVAAEISAITEKASPVGADLLVIEDSTASNAKKRVQISNLPTGLDADAIHDNVAGEIVLITEKISPIGADLLVIEDSAASNAKKRVQISNLPTGADADAIHDNVAAEIDAITEKVTPIGADQLLIEDSAAANVKKKIQISNLPTGADADAIHDNVAGEIAAVTAKATPAGADFVLIEDTAAANVKKSTTAAAIAASGPPATHTHTESDISDLDHDDANAIHDNVTLEIAGITEKATPTGADLLIIEDSVASFGKKKLQISNLPPDADAIHDNVAAEISAITEKTVPIGADLLVIEDSAASNAKKRVQISNLPTGSDADAIHDNVAAEISAITEKTVPVAADLIVIEDSAASNAKKRVQIGNLPGGGSGTGTIPVGSKTNSTDETHNTTPDTITWNSPRFTLDAAWFSNGTGGDFEVAQTGEYEVTVTSEQERVSAGALNCVLELYVNGSLLTDALVSEELDDESDGTCTLAIHVAVSLTATDRIGPRFYRVGAGGHRTTAGGTNFTIKAAVSDGVGSDTDAIHDNVAAEISAVTLKATPAGADHVLIEDSAAANVKKRTTAAAIAASGAPAAHTHTESEITDLDHTDTDAIHDNVSGEIVLITEKVSPIGADLLVIEDSAASNAKKRVQISNLPTGSDADAIHDNVAGEIVLITEKATPVDADLLVIEDSAASNAKKRVTATNLVGSIAPAAHTHTESEITDLDHTDADAIHDNVAAEISAITEKVSPIGADLLVIEDSAASNAKKRVQISNLPTGSDADAIHDNVAAEISAITEKTVPVSADHVLIEDSAASNAKKRTTAGNLIGNITPAAHTHTESEITDLDHTDATAVHDDVAAEISAVTLKATPAGADHVLIEDSAAANVKKRTTAAAVAAAGPPAAHTHTESEITDLDHTDATAIHDDVSGEIVAITLKSTLVGADILLIEDSEATNAKKRTTVADIESAITAPIETVDPERFLVTANNLAFSTNMEGNMDFYNGAVVETLVGTVTESVGVVSFNMEQEGGGDLTFIFSDGYFVFDSTPAASVVLTAGSDVSPQRNFVYVLQSTKALTVSTSGWPSAEHSPIADVLVQSAASVATDEVYKLHIWLNHTSNTAEPGQMIEVGRWIRARFATWISGVSQTLTITPASPDTVIFTTASGVVLQLHEHIFPAFSGTPDLYVVNDSATPYDKITDLNALLTDSTGGSMAERFFSLVIWGAVSDTGAISKLFVNLPGGSYANQNGIVADANKFANFSIPPEFKSIGFLISELKLGHSSGGGGDWTSIAEVDLRGLEPSISAGAGAAQTSEFIDNVFRVQDNGDVSKQIALEASGITTATTRTITMPDKDVTLDDDGDARPPTAHTHIESEITDLDHTDATAIHDDVAAEISVITEKVTPVGADLLVIEDSAASNAKKRVQISNLPTGSDADAIHDNVAAEISAITEKTTPVAADHVLIEDSAASNAKKRTTAGNLIGNIAPAAHTHIESEITDLDHDDVDAIHDNVAAEISAVTLKATPAGADHVLIEDSAAANVKKRTTAAAIAASGAPAAHTHIESEITDLDHDDTNAIHDNVAAEISAITEKTVPIGADLLVIEDSVASNAKKRVQISNLPTGADADAIHDNVAGEIVAITEETTILGDDEIVFEKESAADAKRSGKIRNVVRPIGNWPCAEPHGARDFASPTSRYEKAVLVTKITADLPIDTSSGTFTFVLKAGATIATLSTIGTVSITSGNKTGNATVSVVVAADSVWVVEQTFAGVFPAATEVEKVCTITAYTEID